MKKGEKVMDRVQNQKENKAGILEDMLSFIRYTPNRETDIFVLMITAYSRDLCTG